MTMEFEHRFKGSRRPEVALITNHGYAGVEIPVGGAQDTGGQVLYVNSLARALDCQGYRVTIFTRGGFPHYQSHRLRVEPEYLTEHIRYVFVPGGGSEFLRKEDIAVALDEQVDWLDSFIRREAEERGEHPWEVYEFVNSHYWDGGVLGMRLVERWRDDLVMDAIDELLAGNVPGESLERLREGRHWVSLGENPAYQIGRLLIDHEGSPATPIIQRVRVAAFKWAALAGKENGTEVDQLVGAVAFALAGVQERMAPALHLQVACEALGEAFLSLFPKRSDQLWEDLGKADRHVWTPHSLAAWKEDTSRDHAREWKRKQKFCERRDHERVVCASTRAISATSAEMAERLRSQYGVPNSRLFYFPPCVDRAFFREYSDQEKEPTYQYLAGVSGLSVEKIKSSRMVFETSRMDEVKRKDLLIDAFALVAKERNDVLLFIGGGPENGLTHSLKKHLAFLPELKHKAFLTGHIPGRFIGPLFSICDVYASASEMEGFGTSVMQAAASGAAVVCTVMTPVAVHYLSEEAAIVPAGEVYDFARAIQNLLDDEDVREERSRALKQKVKVFDWEVQVNAFVTYLRSRGIPVAKTQTHLKSNDPRTVREFPASLVATARRSANM